ncbi:hypothetical protein MNV49_002217 [Pseudohyphozyma bogoriensis]|nr:hypothetical protein MNV49_002217 [Pseudohyphozyma bogoriensis]
MDEVPVASSSKGPHPAPPPSSTAPPAAPPVNTTSPAPPAGPKIVPTSLDSQGRRIVPRFFELCELEDLITLIASMLDKLIEHNDKIPLTPTGLTRFHSRAPPAIGVKDYLVRISRYTNVESTCLLILLHYVDKVCTRLPTFTISSLTVHRFIIAAVSVGSKALSDSFCTNGRYARVGGIGVAEMNLLEKEFCEAIDWRLTTTGAVLSHYYTSLVRTHPNYVLSPTPVTSPTPSDSLSPNSRDPQSAMVLGRLTHYAVDVVLVSTILAGVKRSSGFQVSTTSIPEGLARQAADTVLNVGESVFDYTAAAGTGVSHLPAIPKGSIEPTAYANWEVARDLEFGMARVLGEHVLDEVMRDRGAQKSFREFVALQPESNPLMVDFLHDLRVFSDLSTQLRTACRSIEAIYLLKSSPHRLALPISIRGTVLESFHLTSTVGTGVTEPMKELLMRLYEREFQAYMLQKLVESAVARLGNVRLNPVGVDAKERDGLADCYCLTNPRLRDHPIILASEGFVELTGYPLSMIVGRNCRFLQGPGTSPESVTRLRVALNAGKSITSLLLNYRMNGEPFFNLLCMLPLKHSSGLVNGGQIDVTGSIHQLLSQGSSDAGSSIRQGSRSTRFSPAVQSYAEELLASAKRAGTAGAHPTPGGGLEGAGRVRRQGSISTFESDVDTSGARSVGTGTTGSQKSTSASFVGPKRSRKASKRNELGMTMEEQAVLTSSEAANPFLDKLAEFQATYSRVIVVHQRTREVLYFTPELAEFCNLTPQQAEDLIGTDFVKHLVGVPTERTMHLQEFIKSTIKKGQAYASAVGLAPRAKKGFLKKREDMEPKHCILHLTPLANQNGAVEAFVAV